MKQDNKNSITLENQKPLGTVDYEHKVLEVKHLKKHFYVGRGKGKLTIPAVDDISFDVYKREVFGLVGESGCGKTTAARTIIRLYKPTEGTVDINGIRIGAGYLDLKNKIKKVKEDTKEKIISLNRYEFALLRMKKELASKSYILETDIEKLKKQRDAEIKQLENVINEVKDARYKLHNQLVLAVDNVKYNCKLKVSEIKKLTLNAAQREYETELKNCQIAYERKKVGLKESAALEKDVINKRIDELHDEYVSQIAELKQKFEPLIKTAQANVLPAKAAKEQIKALKEKAAHDISAIKVQYQKDKESIKAPDLQAINKQKAEIKDKYAKLIQEKHSSIQKLKDEYNEQVKSTPKVILNAAEKQILKEKTLEIKEAAKKEINELKAKIEQAKEVNRSSDAHLASQKMQMIFQDPISSLNPRMTVKEIVGEGLIIQRQYSDSEIKARVAEALKLVGLSPEYQTRYPHEFSGGQRQRIGIARALIMNPDFIIADEPISALDVSIRAQILNLLTNLKEQLGLTILFIAHDLSVVRFFCDRIAVMYYGKIVEMASAKELFANPMHPYTISLLSAIPQPDPDYEKGRKRIHYNPGQHDYRIDKPSLREIAPGHFVFANDREFEKMQKIYAENNVRSKEAEQ